MFVRAAHKNTSFFPFPFSSFSRPLLPLFSSYKSLNASISTVQIGTQKDKDFFNTDSLDGDGSPAAPAHSHSPTPETNGAPRGIVSQANGLPAFDN
jgi:hypothetical protein